jgi:hypothetical protein
MHLSPSSHTTHANRPRNPTLLSGKLSERQIDLPQMRP